MENKCVIIAGFPGVGKSSVVSYPTTVYDVESSIFHWVIEEDGTRALNLLWPDNYINAIDRFAAMPNATHVLVSTHKEVIEGLLKNHDIVVVMPTNYQKNDYLQRYLRRGSSAEFIAMMDRKFDSMLADLGFWQTDESINGHHATVIRLQRGQYIADILPDRVRLQTDRFYCTNAEAILTEDQANDEKGKDAFKDCSNAERVVGTNFMRSYRALVQNEKEKER